VPYWFVDTGFAALLLLLGAVDAGLGACFLGNFRGEEALAAALGVPDDRRYAGTVLLGEPGGDDPPSASLARGRRRAEDVVHRGRW
jgi:nitroreductase